MENSPSESELAGGSEFMDVEFDLSESCTPGQDQTVRQILAAHPGVRTLNIIGGRVFIDYDPMQTSEKKLRKALEQSGLKIAKEQATTASPLTDAFLEQSRHGHARPGYVEEATEQTDGSATGPKPGTN